MQEERTCGKGLAERSWLPSKLGDLIASLAENLALHLQALDVTDEAARVERDAYLKLAREHREIAARLRAAADEMAGYEELPMGRHDERAMASSRIRECFERFVKLEGELLTLLQAALERDREVLAAMRAASPERG